MTIVNLAKIALKASTAGTGVDGKPIENGVKTPEISAAQASFEAGGTPRNQIDAARAKGNRNLQYVSHFGTRQQQRAWAKILAKREKTTFPYTEANCPGHVAWSVSEKFCGNCGIFVEEIKPTENNNYEDLF